MQVFYDLCKCFMICVSVFYFCKCFVICASVFYLCKCFVPMSHRRIDYDGVAFLIELLEWGRIFSGFGGKNICGK